MPRCTYPWISQDSLSPLRSDPTRSPIAVMPGMQRGWCVDGHPPQKLADYYAARVRGGVQLVISESIAVDHPSGTRSRKFGRLATDTADDWARCVEAVHAAGGHFL